MSYLDALAREAGVRPLSEFVCENPESHYAEETGEGLPTVRWFSAAEGLATARGLLDYLTVHSEVVAEVKRVTGDLRQFEKVLRWLEDEGVPWHLEDGSWW